MGDSQTNISDDPDEESISGSTPDPESDDDMLQNAKDVGLQQEEDEEHPEEVDIARDMNNAEERLKED